MANPHLAHDKATYGGSCSRQDAGLRTFSTYWQHGRPREHIASGVLMSFVLAIAFCENSSVAAAKNSGPKVRSIIAQMQAAAAKIRTADYTVDVHTHFHLGKKVVDQHKYFVSHDADARRSRYVETYLVHKSGTKTLVHRTVRNPRYVAETESSTGSSAQQYFLEQQGQLSKRSFLKLHGTDPARLRVLAFGTDVIRILDPSTLDSSDGAQWSYTPPASPDDYGLLQRTATHDTHTGFAITRFYIDESKGCLVRKIERRTASGKLAFKREISSVVKVDGVWVPQTVHEVVYARDYGKDGAGYFGVGMGDPVSEELMSFNVSSVNKPTAASEFTIAALKLSRNAIVEQQYPQDPGRRGTGTPSGT